MRGLRDLFSPNPLVNGGNYNLETIFIFGDLNSENGESESFRIDTIITPEIFQPYGTSNYTEENLPEGRYFPASLNPEDDYDYGGYGDGGYYNNPYA